MRFEPTAIPGVMVVEAAPHRDERGAFARVYCPDEFAAAGIAFASTQINLSANPILHTLRGMHLQPAPFAEAKLVRAVRGRAFDVALDLRPDSPTFRRWVAAELSAENMRALFLPEGIAHGFLTLEPGTDILYQMGRPYEPGHEAGVRWDDPAFAIAWPHKPAAIAPRDAAYPDFRG
ncbi:MAG TPA: dTDP-4-dehydrorhamnose 3,5-epimerase family protein [Hyphomicrobiales bacterium]|nr:dTDP-4-dehydrorhamnose 3,5-epimerase family protein [Hyphomicrobiales bacterium]